MLAALEGSSPFVIFPIAHANKNPAVLSRLCNLLQHAQNDADFGTALIPSSKKRGGLGVPLDIPLGHKDAAFVRSHFDGMEVRINDAPRAN